ncbi:DUF1471 domain-containing protein [Erwinia aphidicola]|uniref:DUF1471 domain-containing protein n=1 Tax=Erwinia aphidicola TaxID=68334 RepID=UPI003D216955
MKKIIAVSTLLVTAAFTFNASAAQEISREKAAEMKLEKVGTVTTNSTLDPMDAKKHLSKKADEKGGKYFVIIAADEGDHTHALAEVYK